MRSAFADILLANRELEKTVQQLQAGSDEAPNVRARRASVPVRIETPIWSVLNSIKTIERNAGLTEEERSRVTQSPPASTGVLNLPLTCSYAVFVACCRRARICLYHS